jgi:hypothetical protein
VGDPPKVRIEIQSDGTLKKIVPKVNEKSQSHRTCLLKELFFSALETTSSLLKLSVAIRSSPARDDYPKAAARYSIPSVWDIQHVKEKHGNAKYSQPWLLERLGNAIALRRKYLQYRKEHNSKIMTRNEGLENPSFTDGHTIAPTMSNTLPSTVATGVGVDVHVALDEFTVGVEEDARSQTSYEPTMYEGGESTKLTVPKPPELAFDGIPFEYGSPFMCPYCFIEQYCKDRTAWKYGDAHFPSYHPNKSS